MSQTYTFENGVLKIMEGDRVIVDQPHDPATGAPWTDAETALAWYGATQASSEATVETPQGSPVRRLISRLAYTARFTIDEHAAIMAATATDPMVAALMDRRSQALHIDLDYPEQRTGLDYLVSKGLLTAERVEAILSAPITVAELP